MYLRHRLVCAERETVMCDIDCSLKREVRLMLLKAVLGIANQLTKESHPVLISDQVSSNVSGILLS